MCLELNPMDLMDEWKKVTSVVVREWQARKNLTKEEKQEEKGYQDHSLKFCPKKSKNSILIVNIGDEFSVLPFINRVQQV